MKTSEQMPEFLCKLLLFQCAASLPLQSQTGIQELYKPRKHFKERVTGLYWWAPGEAKCIAWIHQEYPQSEPAPTCTQCPGITYFVHLELWSVHGCLAQLEELHGYFYESLKVWKFEISLKTALKELLFHKARLSWMSHELHTWAGLLPNVRLSPFDRPWPALWIQDLQQENLQV